MLGYPPKFKVAKSGRYVRHARAISSIVHSGVDSTFDKLTTMVMQVGQFLDHDITLTPGNIIVWG